MESPPTFIWNGCSWKKRAQAERISKSDAALGNGINSQSQAHYALRIEHRLQPMRHLQLHLWSWWNKWWMSMVDLYTAKHVILRYYSPRYGRYFLTFEIVHINWCTCLPNFSSTKYSGVFTENLSTSSAAWDRKALRVTQTGVGRHPDRELSEPLQTMRATLETSSSLQLLSVKVGWEEQSVLRWTQGGKGGWTSELQPQLRRRSKFTQISRIHQEEL